LLVEEARCEAASIHIILAPKPHEHFLCRDPRHARSDVRLCRGQLGKRLLGSAAPGATVVDLGAERTLDFVKLRATSLGLAPIYRAWT